MGHAIGICPVKVMWVCISYLVVVGGLVWSWWGGGGGLHGHCKVWGNQCRTCGAKTIEGAAGFFFEITVMHLVLLSKRGAPFSQKDQVHNGDLKKKSGRPFGAAVLAPQVLYRLPHINKDLP